MPNVSMKAYKIPAFANIIVTATACTNGSVVVATNQLTPQSALFFTQNNCKSLSSVAICWKW